MSILTVSQVNKYVSFKLSSDLKLKGITVKGEISGLTVNYRSGHMYFGLKDEECVLKGVMFAQNASKLKFTPEEGMSVLVTGNITVYEKGGVYQLIASEITPLGIGQLAVAFEALKEKLKQKGVFDSAAKKQIPLVPKKVAVVTSPTGAALQDILNIIQRRFPVCTVEIYPAGVQGSTAEKSICKALENADKSGADTLILARGGGSAEDLSVFNSENVVMMVYNCQTPVISAVGHETDTTLCDYAADVRAPTPSAAAELCVPDKSEYINAIDLFVGKIKEKLNQRLENYLTDTNRYSQLIASHSPFKKLEQLEKNLDNNVNRINYAVNKNLEKRNDILEKYVGKISALSPFNVLKRGYSLVEKNGSAVDNSAQLEKGDIVDIRFAKGTAKAEIVEISEKQGDIDDI